MSVGPDLSRYGHVRTSTFGAIRTAGFALIPTLLRPHFDIVLPDLEEATLERLESCFGCAVAEVVSIAPDGVVLVRVLPGPLDHHRSLLKRADAQSAG